MLESGSVRLISLFSYHQGRQGRQKGGSAGTKEPGRRQAPKNSFLHFFTFLRGLWALGAPFTPAANPGCDGPEARSKLFPKVSAVSPR